MTTSAGPLTISAAFERSTPATSEWLIRIQNQGHEAITINPSQFRYHTVNKAEQAEVVFAISPADAIEELDRQLSLRNANYSNEQQTRQNLLLINVALAVLNDDPVLEEVRYQQSAMEHDRHHHHQRVSSLEVQRAVLANETLRRTDLDPGEQIYGRVFFPRVCFHGPTKLTVPLGPHEATFLLEQAVEEVPRPEPKVSRPRARVKRVPRHKKRRVRHSDCYKRSRAHLTAASPD